MRLGAVILLACVVILALKEPLLVITLENAVAASILIMYTLFLACYVLCYLAGGDGGDKHSIEQETM